MSPEIIASIKTETYFIFDDIFKDESERKLYLESTEEEKKVFIEEFFIENNIVDLLDFKIELYE